MASASEPNNRYGFKKDILSTLYASRKVVEQSRVERLARIHQNIIDAVARKLLADAFHVAVQNLQILLPQIFGDHVQLPLRFHVFELRHVFERKRQFEVVHDVKDNNVITLGLQRLQTGDDVIRLVVQVGDQD